MTEPTQKRFERFFVEEAIRSLGVGWTIREERDPPDFIIADGDHHFGLDVADIFRGSQNEHGSLLKRAESDTQKLLNNLRRQYEAETRVNLCVKFLGCTAPDTLAKVVSELVALDLAAKPPAYQTTIEIQAGLEAPLKLFVTKGIQSEWFALGDRVGFAIPNPDAIIAAEITKKGKKIVQYKSLVGDDLRLLIVANRIQNSGKIRPKTDSAFDFSGFSAVYCFPYPENSIALRETH